jgi:dolichol-phosphate mannosyltransferase
MKNKILLFIPTYNCEIQIERVLSSIIGAKVREKIDGLLIIDNQSQDKTLEIAQKRLVEIDLKDVRLFRNKFNYSLGGSHKVAFQLALESGYTHLISLHGDDQADVNDLKKVLGLIESDSYDMILGSRFMKDSQVKGYSVLRKIGNHLLNWLVSLRMLKQISDLGSGLNAFSSTFMKDSFFSNCSDGLTFNNHLILCDSNRNRRRVFFPISWKEEDQVSSAKIFLQGFEILKLILVYGGSLKLKRVVDSCSHIEHESVLVWSN